MYFLLWNIISCSRSKLMQTMLWSHRSMTFMFQFLYCYQGRPKQFTVQNFRNRQKCLFSTEILRGPSISVENREFYTESGKNAPPPKHVQITLWLENDSHYFSLYHEKPSICNVCVKFHDNQSVHCRDIAFYKKMLENCRRQHCQLTRARNA